jgi:predicted phosphodiesterase
MQYEPYNIYRCVVGSRVYGLEGEESDTDYRGIFLPPGRAWWIKEGDMRMAILADIHEDVEALREGLDHLRKEGVDQVVVLGDLFYLGRRVEEIVQLLAGSGAVGVWGNHDLGLCHDPPPHFRDRYPARVFDFLKGIGPRLELEGCLFTHGLPHWDATDPFAYYLGDGPETPEGLASSFAASPCRVHFVGHFHRWLAATPEGSLPWDGGEPICLDPKQRFQVVVAAVFDGWCAMYDTDTGLLSPCRIKSLSR